MSPPSSILTPNVCAALVAAAILVVAVACSVKPTDTPAEATNGETDTSSTIPEGASRPATTTSPSSTSPSTSSDSGAATDASSAIADAAAEASVATDAASDAKAEAGPAKLSYGAPCTAHEQCAGNLCLKFDGKLRCTKTCNDDDDCQNGDDCDNDINVCEID